MKKRENGIASLLALVLLVGLFTVGCSPRKSPVAASGVVAPSTASVGQNSGRNAVKEDRKDIANHLMKQLNGTYEELWPVAFQEKYDKVWKESCASAVGEEAAEKAVEQLKTVIGGKVYGKEAVEANKKDGRQSVFDCYFTENVKTLTFENGTIRGNDDEGQQLFEHSYQYIGYDEDLDFYQFKTEDAQAGEFTYFFLRPDTPDTTWHIELRYGSDEKALSAFDSGKYAYWMAAGIPVERDDAMAENAIRLFCTENLT